MVLPGLGSLPLQTTEAQGIISGTCQNGFQQTMRPRLTSFATDEDPYATPNPHGKAFMASSPPISPPQAGEIEAMSNVRPQHSAFDEAPDFNLEWRLSEVLNMHDWSEDPFMHTHDGNVVAETNLESNTETSPPQRPLAPINRRRSIVLRNEPQISDTDVLVLKPSSLASSPSLAYVPSRSGQDEAARAAMFAESDMSTDINMNDYMSDFDATSSFFGLSDLLQTARAPPPLPKEEPGPLIRPAEHAYDLASPRIFTSEPHHPLSPANAVPVRPPIQQYHEVASFSEPDSPTPKRAAKQPVEMHAVHIPEVFAEGHETEAARKLREVHQLRIPAVFQAAAAPEPVRPILAAKKPVVFPPPAPVSSKQAAHSRVPPAKPAATPVEMPPLFDDIFNLSSLAPAPAAVAPAASQPSFANAGATPWMMQDAFQLFNLDSLPWSADTPAPLGDNMMEPGYIDMPGGPRSEAPNMQFGQFNDFQFGAFNDLDSIFDLSPR
jgi:hypothetical protein